MPDEDRIAQLSDAASLTAAEVEKHTARLVDLQSRLEAMESHVRAVRSAQSDAAERLERVSADLDVSAQITSLSAQLESARSAQQRTAERIEAVAAQLDRVDGLENTLAHTSREVVAQLNDREMTVRAELKAISEMQASEQGATGRAIAELVDRLDALDLLGDRVGSAERRQTEADASYGRLAVRVEEVATERRSVEEAVLQADRRQQSRIDAMTAEVTELREEIGTWGGRIEHQTEVLREARAVSDAMSEQARGLHEAHHATAEAQRVAEGRVESALDAMRSEWAEIWERFQSERRNEWQALEQSRAERGVELVETAERLSSMAEDAEAERVALSERLSASSENLAALRRALAEVLRLQRASLDSATDVVESGLPASERSSHQAERREATRRALRAQRETNPSSGEQ